MARAEPKSDGGEKSSHSERDEYYRVLREETQEGGKGLKVSEMAELMDKSHSHTGRTLKELYEERDDVVREDQVPEEGFEMFRYRVEDEH